MSVAIAIFGLALLVLIHEAGHFFASRWVGMTPRKFYIGFGPPIAKVQRGLVEYGFGSIPLGGYVKIPGMSRPSPGDLRRLLGPEQSERHQSEIQGIDAALERGDIAHAAEIASQLRPDFESVRGFEDFELSLVPDAYWRQATWRRLVAIGAGPAVNLLFAVVLFISLYLVASTVLTRNIAHVLPNTPAAAAHVKAGDEVLSIAGRRIKPTDLAKSIRATRGRPFTLVVLRHGRKVTIGPLRARLDQGAYRIGIEIKARDGAGEPLPRATKDGLHLAWVIVSGTVTGLGHIATGGDTRHISSSVGIVRESAAAWRQGLRDFLYALGVISLALGTLNLLPILPLDGGHIVIALIEKVRGKTFRQAVYVRYSAVGLSLFLVLMYLGLRNDLFGSN